MQIFFNRKKDNNCSVEANELVYLKVLGKGSFSVVWLVMSKKSKNLYAAKVLDKSKITYDKGKITVKKAFFHLIF